jgi:predicted anti-sigma-YlaC factor YlaD
MECDRIREAISARIDGENPGVPASLVEAHLAECEGCRGWQRRAHAVTRRARLGGSFLDHDLTPQLLAAVPLAMAGRGRRRALRAGLTAVALAQLAVTVPLLVLGHDHDTGAHAAHELGSFDLALAIAFAVGAIRPVLSAGLAWPSGIAAAALAGTAIADLIGGQAIGADEAQHLIALAGAALLCWQARTARTGTAGPAIADGDAPAGTGPGASGTAAVYLLEDPAQSPDGRSEPGQRPAGSAQSAPDRPGEHGGAGREAVA